MEGNVKISRNRSILWVVGLLCAGLLFIGCKSAPELTAANAQTLIQAKYDQSPPQGASITLHDLGMKKGVAAKYWDRSKPYPNHIWADFKLTPEGAKAVALPSGKDEIEWHPEAADDPNYAVVVTTVATNHLKARVVKDPQDEVGGTKSVVYNESVSLDGVPATLQDMAHDQGNRLSTTRTATFTLENGAWKLDSIN
jgi:hypothetical protein